MTIDMKIQIKSIKLINLLKLVQTRTNKIKITISFIRTYILSLVDIKFLTMKET